MPRRTGLPGLGLALALALALPLAAAPARAGEPRQWPLWPSEVGRVAEPLRAPPEGELRIVPETRRAAAVRALDRFATPLVDKLLVDLLTDRSNPVRREALQACLERQLVACAPGALAIWRAELIEPALRIPALRVLALDPSPERLVVFLGALRDPDEAIRAEAARTIAAIAWPKDQAATVRANLIAKLADPSPAVRRGAAYGLGMLGPGDGALALSRLLADPDPQVRQDVADALGRLRDPRVAPAVLRALQAGDETFVSRAYLVAFAALPGADTDAELLRLLDAPPRNLTHRTVSEVIARRPDPSPALAEGLVVRLREEALRGPALDALLGLGEAARPALIAAQARGLEPPLDLEVRRLLAALDPPREPVRLDVTWPEDQDVGAWQRALADPDVRARLRAAAVLGARAPAWLADAAAWHLVRPAGPEQRRPWLLALATAPAWEARDLALPAALAGWSADRALGSGDRCLALAALARRRPADDLRRALGRLVEATDAGVRACAAGLLHDLSPRTSDPLLAGLLRDPSARVRASAALALACRPGARDEHAATLAFLAARDPDPAVQLAAAQARAGRGRCRWGLVLPPDGSPAAFLGIRWRDRDLYAPLDALGTLPVAFGPGLGDAEPVRASAPVEAPASGRIVFD